jgi:hypothetical protein
MMFPYNTGEPWSEYSSLAIRTIYFLGTGFLTDASKNYWDSLVAD